LLLSDFRRLFVLTVHAALTRDRSEAAMTFTTLLLAQVLTSFAPAIIGSLVAAGSAAAASINQSRLGLAWVSPSRRSSTALLRMVAWLGRSPMIGDQ
jgi:hypothetical protein